MLLLYMFQTLVAVTKTFLLPMAMVSVAAVILLVSNLAVAIIILHVANIVMERSHHFVLAELHHV